MQPVVHIILTIICLIGTVFLFWNITHIHNHITVLNEKVGGLSMKLVNQALPIEQRNIRDAIIASANSDIDIVFDKVDEPLVKEVEPVVEVLSEEPEVHVDIPEFEEHASQELPVMVEVVQQPSTRGRRKKAEL